MGSAENLRSPCCLIGFHRQQRITVVSLGLPATPIQGHQVVDDQALQEWWVDMRGFTICAMVIDKAQVLDQSPVR